MQLKLNAYLSLLVTRIQDKQMVKYLCQNIGKKRKGVGGWIPREVHIAYAHAKPYIKAISPRIRWLMSSY